MIVLSAFDETLNIIRRSKFILRNKRRATNFAAICPPLILLPGFTSTQLVFLNISLPFQDCTGYVRTTYVHLSHSCTSRAVYKHSQLQPAAKQVSVVGGGVRIVQENNLASYTDSPQSCVCTVYVYTRIHTEQVYTHTHSIYSQTDCLPSGLLSRVQNKPAALSLPVLACLPCSRFACLAIAVYAGSAMQRHVQLCRYSCLARKRGWATNRLSTNTKQQQGKSMLSWVHYTQTGRRRRERERNGEGEKKSHFSHLLSSSSYSCTVCTEDTGTAATYRGAQRERKGRVRERERERERRKKSV